MSKITLERQELVINKMRKKVKYDTKEYTLEFLYSKYNKYIEENKSTEIFIPFYQRKFVWSEEKQSKFIESIILGLPVPPIYFAEVDDGVLEIIDGSQRIRTINAFLKNELKLKGLEKLKELNQLRFNDFSSSRKRKINNSSIRSIVVTDIDEETMIIRHEIFERLNTGGEILKRMEVKKGAKEGEFIRFIYEDCSNYSILEELSLFNKQDKLRAYKEEFLIKYFAFVDSMTFDIYINDYLNDYIVEKNNSFKDNDANKDSYLYQFKTMLTFIKDNNLIKDITINRKNKLLALYIGVSLALQNTSELKINDLNVFNDKFIENSKSNGFNKLKENVELVKNIILGKHE